MISTIPTQMIDPPWDSAISSIEAFFSPTIPFNNGLIQHLNFNDNVWEVALHWLLKKKWHSKHKIPVSRNVATKIEPLGEFLLQILEICSQVHLMYPSGYINATEWFYHIVLEMRNGDINEICTPIKKGDGKFKHCSEIRSHVKVLKQSKNPFDSARSPHTYRLIEASINLSQKSDKFDDGCYQPLIKAYSSWGRNLHDDVNWQMLTVDKEKLFIHAGKGRGKVKIA